MATKQELLNKVLGEIKTKVSPEIIVDFSKDSSKIKRLGSWGSLLADQIAPLCKGRVYELFGPESSGKSSLAISACANIIEDGGIAVYIDAECAFNFGFAEALGLDIKSPNFVLIQPDTEEDALASVIKICESGAVDLVVLDSTNAMNPKAMILEPGDSSEELSTQRVGLKAKILNQALAQIVPTCNRTGTACIFISQVRDNLNMFGSPETIGVGRGLAFYASIRIRIVRTGRIEGDLPDGTKGIVAIPIRIETIKNKIIAPFKKVDIQINVEGPNKGICVESEYTQVAFNLGILKKDNRGILLAETTPLYPDDTPLASSMPKLNEILGEVHDEEHPFYWIKKLIELKVKENLEQITTEEVNDTLAEVYELKNKENELAAKYLELANQASGSSKIVEAYHYIQKAYHYNSFDKNISNKYKIFEKRYNDKKSTITNFICEVEDVENSCIVKINFETGETISDEGALPLGE